jgi:hypothetical protein
MRSHKIYLKDLYEDLNRTFTTIYIRSSAVTAFGKQKLGLVDFMDNWPWTSIVHGQLAMCYGQCPCNLANVHVLWPMSMCYDQCPCVMANVHVLWPMSMCYGQCPCVMANVHVLWPMSMFYGQCP